jgi:hypothetical protein
MTTIAIQPSLNQLYSFVSKIRTYPISVRQLLKLAAEKGEPKTVVEFYRTFPEDQVFEDEEDLAGRSEQIGIMRQDEKDMPKEEQVATEEF